MRETPPTPLVVSLLLDCDAGVGHSIDYNRSIQRACTMNGWEHSAALTTLWSAHLQDAPPAWEVCLASPDFTQLRGQPARQLAGVHRLGGSLADYLRRLRRIGAPAQQPVVLLLETFSLSTLAALAYGLQRVRPRQTSVWLLYRGIVDLRTAPRHTRLYRWLNQRIASAVRPCDLQILTDSEPLAVTYRTLLGRDVQALPVPHTPPILPTVLEGDRSILRCWWPGAPRAEKGAAIIQALLASQDSLAGQFHLYASQDARLTAPAHHGRMQVTPLPAHLSRVEYLAQLASSDLVLLPYDAKAYQQRTSGVFIETIVAGKLPAVTQDTWMAGELLRYDLPELVIDWRAAAVLDQLATVARSEIVRVKLHHMQRAYAEYHNETSLARVLNLVWQRTGPCSN